jgi:hypothetical protein
MFKPANNSIRTADLNLHRFKILVLIIACDNPKHYVDMQAMWMSNMRSHSAFDVWFVKSKPASMWILDTDLLELDEASRTVFVKQDETYIPGILNKTIVAMDYFFNKYSDYTHVWRTNLSSVLDFDGFLQFLWSDVGRRCAYAGFSGQNGSVSFASGAGFLLIREAALFLVANHSLVLSWDQIDDVAIGRILCPVFGLTHIDRLWVKNLDEPIRDAILEKGIFQFRCETYNHSNTLIFMQKVFNVIRDFS